MRDPTPTRRGFTFVAFRGRLLIPARVSVPHVYNNPLYNTCARDYCTVVLGFDVLDVMIVSVRIIRFVIGYIRVLLYLL